jgi:tRNA (guanine-N7-)-methyltransferase
MRDRFHFDPAEVAVGAVADLHAGDERALHVEVGFGKDVRILREAGREPDAMFLGVEVSRKKAQSFCRKVARAGLRNVRCYWGDVRTVLADLAPASVASFTILFPDPWPKRRHHKHRWIQAPAARQLAAALAPGGWIITATDHDGYATQIREVLTDAGLTLELETREIPEEDRSLFAQRFERLGESITYHRWRKSSG